MENLKNVALQTVAQLSTSKFVNNTPHSRLLCLANGTIVTQTLEPGSVEQSRAEGLAGPPDRKSLALNDLTKGKPLFSQLPQFLVLLSKPDDRAQTGPDATRKHEQARLNKLSPSPPRKREHSIVVE